MDIHHTDCLIIGSGLAGSAFAHYTAKQGLECALVSSDALVTTANSDWAQGGIIFHDQDDAAQLSEDIMRAGDGAANKKAIESLVKNGPGAVKSFLIDELQVDFDRDESGALKFTREGGHSRARIIYSKDRTGHSILQAVHRRLSQTPGIEHINRTAAVDLLTPSHSSVDYSDRFQPLSCAGAYVLDLKTGKIGAIAARSTILATGGVGQIYSHTTNQSGTYGHGVAMAYRVGARVMDMEYVQFHPTAFHKKGAPTFLISEALRGEGGILVNSKGEAFMDPLHPLKSLAPRDFVSRSIHNEMMREGNNSVFLEMSHLDAESVRQRFPNLYSRCLQYGVDMTIDPIPVAPAAHYLCGGIHTDLEGRTNIRNLYAIGETACTGLHGANRLASTSLLECLTSAKFAAETVVREFTSTDSVQPQIRTWESPTAEADLTLINQDINLIKNTMTNYVGLVRSFQRLNRARNLLRELKSEIDDFYAGYKLSRAMLDLRSAVQTALLIVHAATLNPRSRGCHYREDEDASEIVRQPLLMTVD